MPTVVQKKWFGHTQQFLSHLGLPKAIVLVGLTIGDAGLGILFSFALALVTTVLVALGGFDVLALAGEEVDHPQWTIPLAMLEVSSLSQHQCR